ncbi:MAG: penicillin-binding protein 2 [Thermoleophilia bacterium]|nr:penicillin-binding protein 2 [Thermoleophilia bacterium]
MTGRRPSASGRGPLTPASAMRIAALGVAAVVLLGILVTRLWFLQVIGGQAYANQADQNRIRVIDLPAQRGTIVDRNGDVLATVRQGWNLVARPLDLRNPRRQSVIRSLAQVLGKPPRPMLKDLAIAEQDTPYDAVILAKDVPLALRAAFAERQGDFPGVSLQRGYVRTYPMGEYAAHVLGFTGSINADDAERYKQQGYVGNEIVGKAGLEQEYESYLKGTKGRETVEVDATGRPVGGGVYETVSPTPGNTLVVSLDMRVQRALQDQLRERVATNYQATGAAGVALDPETGEVLGMASYPTYDPEDFVRGRMKRIRAYYRKDAGNPTYSRFMQGGYPPGSTFKPITLTGALETPLPVPGSRPPVGLTPGTVMHSGQCVPLYDIEICNFDKENQGELSMPGALEWSSNTIFALLGNQYWHYYDRTGTQLQQRWAEKYGLGRPTGIDLPGEGAARIPDVAWKKTYDYGDGRTNNWQPGDNINMAMGQGDVQVTPLQMAVAFAAIANGGKLVTPTLGERVQTPAGSLVRQLAGAHPPQPIGIKPSTMNVLHDGLKLVTTGANGTATSVFGPVAASGGPVIAGKTGTAQTNKVGISHSWFVGYAPADRPRIVVAVMVEYGGTGATAAAPAVCNVIAAYGPTKFDPGLCGTPRKAD